MSRLVVAAIFAVGVSACAAISGLGDYAEGELSGDASVQSRKGDAAGSDVTTPPPDPTSDPGDDVAVPPGDDDSSIPIIDTSDAGIPDAAYTDVTSVPDGYACGVGTCGGCCTAAGDCVGGQSVTTCGVGGNLCKDCSSQGACGSSGSCKTPVVDSGPPPKCSASTCTNTCSGTPIQNKCCKGDNTCGCQWTPFAPCN